MDVSVFAGSVHQICRQSLSRQKFLENNLQKRIRLSVNFCVKVSTEQIYL